MVWHGLPQFLFGGQFLVSLRTRKHKLTNYRQITKLYEIRKNHFTLFGSTGRWRSIVAVKIELIYHWLHNKLLFTWINYLIKLILKVKDRNVPESLGRYLPSSISEMSFINMSNWQYFFKEVALLLLESPRPEANRVSRRARSALM